MSRYIKLHRLPDFAIEAFSVTPKGWVKRNHPLGIDLFFEKLGRTIYVLCSGWIESDGRRWLHVSCSRPCRQLPTWEDLKRVKEDFLGDRKAIQVFPSKKEYVNISEVLHLWSCLDEDGLPDFRHEGGI